MALFPVVITRSIMVLETKKTQEKVSCSFIARFADGSEKVINAKTWQPIGLLRKSDIGEMVMDNQACSLYYRDWTNNPTRGTMVANYPQV